MVLRKRSSKNDAFYKKKNNQTVTISKMCLFSIKLIVSAKETQEEEMKNLGELENKIKKITHIHSHNITNTQNAPTSVIP